jgi:hypothetical protein
MATTLPFGIRVAAGLVATSFDHLVKLPGELPGLTVSFAGQLLRTSMRVRQEVAELATKGDELLAPLIGGADEHPAWATFDEDEDEDNADDATTGEADAGGRASAAADPDEATPVSSPSDGAAGDASIGEPILVSGAEHAGAEIPLDELFDEGLPESRASDDGSTDDGLPPNAEAQDPTRTLVGSLGVEGAPGSPGIEGDGLNPDDFLDLPTDAGAGVDDLVFTTTSDSYDTPILADHQLSVAELKDRLPDLDSAAVRLLLAQEESGPNRAPYLTLLTNRLTTLQHENR